MQISVKALSVFHLEFVETTLKHSGFEELAFSDEKLFWEKS